MVIKEIRWREFILDIPDNEFNEIERKKMIEYTELYIKTNSWLRSQTRKQMLNHPITLLGKYYFENFSEEAAYWYKIKERAGLIIQDKKWFMDKLKLTMDRVPLIN